MKQLQLMAILFVLVIVGFANVRGDLETIRIIRNPDDIRTAVIGNSHSNALLYPPQLSAYYLNEPGALSPQKLLQAKEAVNHFSNLQLVISDIGPTEFYACVDPITVRINNILRMGEFDLFQVIPNILAVSNLLIADPRKFFNNPAPRFDPNSGKAIVRDTAVTNIGAKRHLGTCKQAENLSMNWSVDSLESLVSFIERHELPLIFVIPPHTKEYRTEMAEHKRGSLAVLTMYNEILRIETGNKYACLIDLYDLELEIDSYLDSDHLSTLGEKRVAPILVKEIHQCLTDMELNLLVP